MSDESLKTYIESKLPRADDRELLDQLLKVFEESGRDGLKKHLSKLIDELEEG